MAPFARPPYPELRTQSLMPLAPVESSLSALEAPAAPLRFVGRQPIVDERGRLFGYELLSRPKAPDVPPSDPEAATREIVDYWSMLIPDPHEGFAFVNCTRATLVEGTVTLLPSSNTVLEILEDIEPDAEVIASCRTLKERGYRLALDDFTAEPRRAPLLELADFVKIDFLATDARSRRAIYSMAAGTPVRFLAEKIETEDSMRVALAEGCRLFQGYFFSRPVTVATRPLPQNSLVYLRLLAALHRSPANLAEIERLVMSDASLCYRVLRLANSALYALNNRITSVRGALLMVGDDAVRRMVSVAVATALAGHSPTPLLSMALVRARFCELLASRIGAAPEEFYLLGLLSLLDALLEMPIDRILEAIPVSLEMKAALSGKPGTLRCPLDLLRCLESCDWSQCDARVRSFGLTEEAVAALYLASVRWATTALQIR